MSTLNGQELEIFRAGQHGIAGKRVFSADEVAQIARDYDPASGHEAPIVIGHPKLDSPAWGWIKSLRADKGVLYGTPHEVVPEFDAAVQTKQYKKRSAAFDPLPDGRWQLRHVGFLGGTPPAVKGLADAKFASEQYEEFEYSTEGDGMPEIQQIDQKTFTGWFREAFADLGFPFKKGDPKSDEITALEQRLSQKFADDLKAERDAREAKEREFADYKAQQDKGAKSASAMAAIDKLKADRKWLPAFDKMGVAELFAAVAAGETQEIEFADANKETKKVPILDALSAFVGRVASFVPAGTQFSAEGVVPPVPANAPKVDGAAVDDASVKFDADVRARAAEKKISYSQSLNELTREGKSSQSYAASTSGQV